MSKLKQSKTKIMIDDTPEWQARWALLGRPTLLWLLGVLIIVPAMFEVLFYFNWEWGGWSWAVAFVLAAGSLMLLLRPCKPYFPSVSWFSAVLFTFYTMAGLALTLGAWHVQLNPPTIVQNVEDITDWRTVRYVQVQQPMLYYDQTKTNVRGQVSKHSYSTEMLFRVPMDQNGWVYLDVHYYDDWDQTDNVSLHEQNQLAFIKRSTQQFESTDFAYAAFFSVEAAPKIRGGYRNHANLQAHFQSFDDYKFGQIAFAVIAYLVLIICWFIAVKRESFDKRAYLKWCKSKTNESVNYFNPY